jgi:hypothetical protein
LCCGVVLDGNMTGLMEPCSTFKVRTAARVLGLGFVVWCLRRGVPYTVVDRVAKASSVVLALLSVLVWLLQHDRCSFGA